MEIRSIDINTTVDRIKNKLFRTVSTISSGTCKHRNANNNNNDAVRPLTKYSPVPISKNVTLLLLKNIAKLICSSILIF